MGRPTAVCACVIFRKAVRDKADDCCRQDSPALIDTLGSPQSDLPASPLLPTCLSTASRSVRSQNQCHQVSHDFVKLSNEATSATSACVALHREIQKLRQDIVSMRSDLRAVEKTTSSYFAASVCTSQNLVILVFLCCT